MPSRIPRRRGALRGVVGALTVAALVAPVDASANERDGDPAGTPADGNSSLVMVLDASGSMAEDDGEGGTRMAAAQRALGTAVDALPEEYPTGLRLFGSESSSCADTRLAQPVEPLDREALRAGLDEAGPTGNTPTSLALEKAVDDLPEVPHGAVGRQTVLLVSDGESNCGEVPPCEVAADLVGDGSQLRIDTVGFQITDEGRAELECVAEAGHGTYYDAPDGEALGRELERAARLSADGYHFDGTEVEGGASADRAADLEPGQYLDRVGPGETRWYGVDLDAESAADLAVTAVPHPGVPVAYLDGLELRLTTADERSCDRAEARFRSDEGAMHLTQTVSRIPSDSGDDSCDEAGRYLLSVERTSEDDSDRAHWPIELRFGVEDPLDPDARPGASATEVGDGADAALPTDEPEDVTGGTGFNDATELTPGVYRDELLPAQTRYYRVPVGWGQQLRYRVEIGNEPTLESSGPRSHVRTQSFSPNRQPIAGGDFTTDRSYYGEQLALDGGTVPVSWTNRWERGDSVQPVRVDGDTYVAVSLGPDAVRIARNASIGVVLRVDVLGEELAGPEHDAPPAAEAGDTDAGDGDSAPGGGTAADEGAGWPVPAVMAGAGVGVALLAAAVAWAIRSRRRAATAGPAADPGGPHDGTTRGSW